MLESLAIHMDLKTSLSRHPDFFLPCVIRAPLFIRGHFWHFGWEVVPTLPLGYLCHTW